MKLKTTEDFLLDAIAALPPKELRDADDTIAARILHDALEAHRIKREIKAAALWDIGGEVYIKRSEVNRIIEGPK